MKRLSRFQRGFASTFGMEIVARGMSALTLIVLLRALSVEGFAFVVLLLNAGQFLGSAATGGLRLRYTRMEAERISRGIDEPSAFHATLIGGSCLVLAAAVVGFLGASLLDVGSTADRLRFAALGTGFTLGHAAVEMAVFHYQAQLAFVKAGAIQLLRNALLLLIACAAAVGLLGSGTAVGIGFVVVVACVALIFAAPLALATRGAAWTRENRIGFGRESASLTLYSLASAGWAYLDLFVVAALLNDVAVASYGAALRYIAIIMGPAPALVSVMRIRTAQQDMVDSDHAQIQLMVRWAKRLALPAAAALLIGGVAATWVIPWINGGRYPDSIEIFRILLISAFVQFLTLPNSSVLIAQKRYTTLAWLNAGAVIVNVGVAIVTAHFFGVVGVAAAGTAITIVQVSAVTFFAAHPPDTPRTNLSPAPPQTVRSDS